LPPPGDADRGVRGGGRGRLAGARAGLAPDAAADGGGAAARRAPPGGGGAARERGDAQADRGTGLHDAAHGRAVGGRGLPGLAALNPAGHFAVSAARVNWPGGNVGLIAMSRKKYSAISCPFSPWSTEPTCNSVSLSTYNVTSVTPSRTGLE